MFFVDLNLPIIGLAVVVDLNPITNPGLGAVVVIVGSSAKAVEQGLALGEDAGGFTRRVKGNPID